MTTTAWDAAAAAVAYDEVRVRAGAVWWLQSLPDEGGRVALMRDGVETTPRGADVGGDLHGYGGGAYTIGEGQVFYVDRADGNLRTRDGRVLLRRGDDEQIGDLAYAAGRLFCVRESGRGDELLEIRAGGGSRVLASSSGFLGSPRPGPDGLAWLRWDADRMPWDGAELVYASWAGSGLGPARRIAGGREESVTQPCWDGRGRLWFCSDRSQWWNVSRWDGAEITAVAPMAADCAPPEWEAGYASFAPLPGGGAVVIAQNGPRHRLLVVGEGETREIPTPHTSFKPYLSLDGRRAYAVAGSPARPAEVVGIDLEGAAGIGGGPGPEVVTSPVSALVHPPRGAPRDWTAPLVVRAHPGPTSSMTTRLDPHVTYLTGNGFAVADVDYRGSSGYGRDFRQSLYGRWGTADVEDCAALAEHLIRIGRTRPGQVFVTGASAGGYTALRAVSRPSVFAGAVARSAVIDPLRWRHTVPRWQRPHAAALAGADSTVRPGKPILLIHGSGDHIAPLADAGRLAPDRLLVLDAGHHLSARHATARALEAELAFYRGLLES